MDDMLQYLSNNRNFNRCDRALVEERTHHVETIIAGMSSREIQECKKILCKRLGKLGKVQRELTRPRVIGGFDPALELLVDVEQFFTMVVGRLSQND